MRIEAFDIEEFFETAQGGEWFVIHGCLTYIDRDGKVYYIRDDEIAGKLACMAVVKFLRA